MVYSVQAAFDKFKSNLEITDNQGAIVSVRQKSIRDVVAGGMDVTSDFLTGSYARSTMIAPLTEADIDVFIILHTKYYSQGPAGLLDSVKRVLLKTYTRTPDISRNGQAVTVRFSDFVVDVVVGFYRTGGGYLIANSARNSWLETDPKKHVEIFAQANKAHDGKLVPLIKMIKGWNKSNGSFFRSFHLEVLAREALNGIGISDYPSGLRFFFDKARALVQSKNLDPAGYGDDIGKYIDTQAKLNDAVTRFQRAHDTALRAEQFATRGDIRSGVTEWQRLISGYFPPYG